MTHSVPHSEPSDPTDGPSSVSAPSTRVRLGVACVALLCVVTSCGSSTDTAASNEIATLGGDTDAPTEEVAAEAQDSAEIALEFTECMRDNGVDMDDPTFDADGNIEGGLGFGRGSEANASVDPRSEEFQAAIGECGSLIEDLDLGGQNRGRVDPSEIEAALLTYTSCLRDEGVAVDDVSIGGDRANAAGAPAAGEAPADGAEGGFAGGERPDAGGQRPEGAGGEGFDPMTRMIERLGIDSDDPEVAAALDTCAPELEAAFAGATGAPAEES